jgi:LEA14-like dessication related protein
MWKLRHVCSWAVWSLFGFAFVPGCGTVQQTLQDLSAQHPSARVSGVRLADIGLQSLQLIFDVTVENPYSFDLPLLDVDYALATHGRTFLNGSTEVEGKVSARHAHTVELPVRVDLISLVSTITSTSPGHVVPYTAELGLRVDVPGSEPLRFPLRTSGELPVPKAPAVRVSALRWSETSLSKVEGELRLDVENTNTFPFSVTQLRWDLSLSDTPVASGGNRQALPLDPAQVGTLPVGLSFSPLNLGTGLVHVLTDLNRESIDYSIAGIMSVDTAFGSIELPYVQSGVTRSESSP